VNELVDCAGCGQKIRHSARSCVYCDTPRSGGNAAASPSSTRNRLLIMRITPPGGNLTAARPIPLEEGVRTMIGREAGGAIGDVMDAAGDEFDDVSRTHVYVTARGRQVEVEDRSMRGTFHRDNRLTLGQRTRLPTPVTLRLASGCFISIQLERV
jgi:hypothetical protein